MLFGCKPRRAQKFPGTEQSITLARSTAVRMPVSGLCAQGDGEVICTVTGKCSLPTPGIAVHPHRALRALYSSVLIKTLCDGESFLYFHLFIFACAGSSLLCMGFP